MMDLKKIITKIIFPPLAVVFSITSTLLCKSVNDAAIKPVMRNNFKGLLSDQDAYALRAPIGRDKNREEGILTELSAAQMENSAAPVDITIARLIQEAELAMPRCDDKKQDWSKFNEILDKIEKIKDVKIGIALGENFDHRKVNINYLRFMVPPWSDNEIEDDFLLAAYHNIEQHVKSGIGLAIRRKIITEKGSRYSEISVIDNGTGPIDRENRKAAIAEILEFGVSKGKGGAHGTSLSIATRCCSDISVIHAPGESVVVKGGLRLSEMRLVPNIIWKNENSKPYGMTVIGYFYEADADPKDVKKDIIRRTENHLTALAAFNLENTAINFSYGRINTGDLIKTNTISLPLLSKEAYLKEKLLAILKLIPEEETQVAIYEAIEGLVSNALRYQTSQEPIGLQIALMQDISNKDNNKRVIEIIIEQKSSTSHARNRLMNNKKAFDLNGPAFFIKKEVGRTREVHFKRYGGGFWAIAGLMTKNPLAENTPTGVNILYKIGGKPTYPIETLCYIALDGLAIEKDLEPVFFMINEYKKRFSEL